MVDAVVETVIEIASDVRAGRRRARDVMDATLARIESVDGEVNAWCAVDAERARRGADAIDRRIASGDDPGVLAGVPIGVKDLEDAAGFATVCGDPARVKRDPATVDSIEVARLVAAGAVVVGKTNTPAYGFHAETDNLVFGPTRNPWALARTAGGSSGGSAAAVASGTVSLCTGSDGGGSIRIPSSACGIAGFKTTHGVVPMGDTDAPTWGPFSTRGPMARTFEEIAYALDVVKGSTPRDLLSFDLAGSFVDASARASLEGVRFIWAPTLGYATPDPAILSACEAAVERLVAAGAHNVDTVIDVFDEPPVRAWAMRAAPGSLRTANADPMPWEGRFLAAAQLTASFGDHVSVADMIEGEAGAHRCGVRLAALYERADVIITPAMAALPPRVGEASEYGPSWAADYTLPFNLVRAPAAVVPCGTLLSADGETLPMALQLAMPRGADLRLMSVSVAAQHALGGVEIPPLFAH